MWSDSGMTDRLDPARLAELWDFDDPDASAERFRAESTAVGPIAAAELATQLARALGLAGRRAEAEGILDDLPDEPVVRVRAALERGRLLNSAGSPGDAVPYFEDALELAIAEGEDYLAVDAAHMLAIADTSRSGEWTERGIHLVEASQDARTRRWLVGLRNNRGWTLFDEGDLDAALAEFELAAAAAAEHGSEEQRRYAAEAVAEAQQAITARHADG